MAKKSSVIYTICPNCGKQITKKGVKQCPGCAERLVYTNDISDNEEQSILETNKKEESTTSSVNEYGYVEDNASADDIDITPEGVEYDVNTGEILEEYDISEDDVVDAPENVPDDMEDDFSNEFDDIDFSQDVVVTPDPIQAQDEDDDDDFGYDENEEDEEDEEYEDDIDNENEPDDEGEWEPAQTQETYEEPEEAEKPDEPENDFDEETEDEDDEEWPEEFEEDDGDDGEFYNIDEEPDYVADDTEEDEDDDIENEEEIVEDKPKRKPSSLMEAVTSGNSNKRATVKKISQKQQKTLEDTIKPTVKNDDIPLKKKNKMYDPNYDGYYDDVQPLINDAFYKVPKDIILKAVFIVIAVFASIVYLIYNI